MSEDSATARNLARIVGELFNIVGDEFTMIPN